MILYLLGVVDLVTSNHLKYNIDYLAPSMT